MGRRSAIILCVAVAALVALGLVMLASTSVWVEDEDTRYFHVKRQVLWMCRISTSSAMLRGNLA